MNSKIKIVALLSGLIRPVTTICYTAIFFYLIWFCIEFAANKDLPPKELVELSIITVFLDINMMIISFWFMNREFNKRKK